ncbi:MAG: pseudouridine synthase [Pseudoxanthomonas sp.]
MPAHLWRDHAHVAEDPVASSLQLPPGPWPTLLDGLCARFPRIDRGQWRDRFSRGRVLDEERRVLAADAPYEVGKTIFYFREVVDEAPIPFHERVIHVDEHLVVADKPHFLPVAPTGRHVRETLLTRLVDRLGLKELVPLHRIDRDTAGLVLFSADPRSRGAYQELFRERRIEKRYEAVAPAMPERTFPLVRETRLAQGEPFFRMSEVAGIANAKSRVEVLAAEGDWWRYALFPVSGRKHQLRVHMAALGAPIRNDPYYPQLTVPAPDDYSRPLQLLARGLCFVDPFTGLERDFESRRELGAAP